MRKLGTVALWTLAVLLLPLMAGAEEAAGAAAAAVADTNSWGYALGAGIAIGFGALGCGIGQGLTAGNTTAGIARNPGAAGSMFTNFILGMVLIESISIYALVIGLLLVFRIT
jgi:F-type H+-transporting ATPase subunit c